MFIPLWFTSDSLKIKKTGIGYLIGASVLLSLYTYLFFKGLKVGNAGAGGVLVTTLNPIITYIIVLVINQKKPGTNELAGLVAGLIACIVLLNVWQQPDLFSNGGNMYFLFATITWSILSLLTAKAGNFGRPIIFSLWMYGICSLIMSTLSDTQLNIKLILEGDWVFWFNLFFSSTITTSIATTFYFYATSQFGAAKASLYIFLVPLTAAIGSWIFLEEQIKIHTIIGGLLGILAIYLINFKTYRKESDIG